MDAPIATPWIVEVIAELSTDGEAAARAEAARLLRHAAARIEQGLTCGGFHLSEADHNNGAFALIARDLL